jgi:dihydroorotate dehydrogenase
MIPLPFDIYPFVRPLIFYLDPELAHHLAVLAFKKRLVPAPKIQDYPVLHTTLGGAEFAHPIGLAAGFDKQAEIIQPLFKLGFSSVEIGGVTPLPQPGNPKPRMFRLAESSAIINRFNFNSVGFDVFLRRLQAWYDDSAREKPRRVVGVNLAKGDGCVDDAESFILGLKKFAPYVRFVTLNVSCPNEACARQLEAKDRLNELLGRIKTARDEMEIKPLLFVKISPDQTELQANTIAEVVLASGIDGMIVSNTTVMRPASLASPVAKERGGLSGKPLFEMSTKLLGKMYQLTGGKVPLIGSGGVFSGADAYAKIRAGATLVQIYTAMVFEGPYVVSRIVGELATLLNRDGFVSVKDAVGADFKKYTAT